MPPPPVSQDTFKSLLGKLVKTPEYFTAEDLQVALECIFTPDVVHPVQIGSFLTALHIERIERRPEFLAAAANVLRARALKAAIEGIDGDFVVDIVGTGGDGHNTFNVSTTAAIVAAGAGARVVKHGSRASTSSSGSADLLQSLGCYFTPPSADAPLPISRIPFTFIMAPQYHLSLAMIAPYRKALPHRTMFNVLGPLINPARPRGMVLGVAERELGPTFAHSLADGGVQRAFVVCGAEGLDEISCAGDTFVWELRPDGSVAERTVHPRDFGLEAHPLSEVAGASPEENAATFRALLQSGKDIPEKLTPVLDFVLMNAAALLVVAGIAEDLKDGVAKARESITSGKAWNALEQFRDAGLAAASQAQNSGSHSKPIHTYGTPAAAHRVRAAKYDPPCRGRGQNAGRTYSIPKLNTVTQSTANTEPDLLPDADVTEGLLSEPLRRFTLPSVPRDGTAPSIQPENFKYLGSYNWLDSPNPTILVPGSPRIWRDRPLPFRVPFDEGLQIFDPNGYHMGSSASSPLIPLFCAVDAVAEDNADTTMDWPSIDIIADRSSLRKLLRWVRNCDAHPDLNDPQPQNSYPSGKVQDFRIDLQLGGAKTELGGIQMVVRFEVDAQAATVPALSRDNAGTPDEISEALAGLSLACRTSANISHTPAPLAPSLDDPDAVVTVIGGVHYLAVHQRGVFETINTRPLNSPQFQRVAARDGTLVAEHGRRGRLSLVCRGGRLEAFERGDGNDVGCLPDPSRQNESVFSFAAYKFEVPCFVERSRSRKTTESVSDVVLAYLRSSYIAPEQCLQLRYTSSAVCSEKHGGELSLRIDAPVAPPHAKLRYRDMQASWNFSILSTPGASTIILSVVAAFVAVQAAPAAFQKRDVDPALVPDFGVVPGTGADGTGNCLGINNVKIPCACPPDRNSFIASLNANVNAGHMINNPPIAAPFPTGNSKGEQQARIATLLSTLQNLHGPGVGCPAVSTVYGRLQQQINALPN
ncbi:anthranilate phosphoribosyltransferase [Dichomitus squalens]|uniref:Anthranilate phosphoribosyltransferase n=1 Tax=Dichomitus squalens TaxID=114155 RepID=A0A4Q9PL03_9APHY|nr:anthranilate phosphoribosyltransferase [Dichomitus squalens]TBU54822.1 anthranilate phosphoribosyltransferase [Dichomitus squalens]